MAMSVQTEAEARTVVRTRYSSVAMALHWIIALAITVQIGAGWYMGSLEDRTAEKAVERIHIALGLTILLLTLGRLGWRLANRPPPEPAGLAPWERILATAIHKLFYVLMLLLPLSGWCWHLWMAPALQV